MAKKSKKGKKAKKAKKAVVAKKKSAKKASKKAAKKSAKKAAKKGAKKSAKKAAKKSKAAAPTKAAKKSPAKKKPAAKPAAPKAEPAMAAPEPEAGAELGYRGVVHTLMGVRLIQRRRPQLTVVCRKQLFEEAAASTLRPFSCGLSHVHEGCSRQPEPYFHGEVDSQKASFDTSLAAAFLIPVAVGGSKTPQIVVRMQHTRTTFIETARTPKKAAHACLFCFTIVTPHTTV